MTFPKKFGPADVPLSVKTLVETLLPQLLEGTHPALAALREQLQGAQITEVEMTGSGFYVDFAVPPEAPLADPRNFAGGHADIKLTSVQYGAGCIVFVRQGRLATFEGHTYAGSTWAVDAHLAEIRWVAPVSPG